MINLWSEERRFKYLILKGSSIKSRLNLVLWILVLATCLVNQEENSSDDATKYRSQHILPKVLTEMCIIISRELALLEHDIEASEDWVDAS